MGHSINTFIIVGVRLDPDWGKLPTDGEGDQDAYDDWVDRWGEPNSYDPKPGEWTMFSDLDGNRYLYIGRVVDFNQGRWTNGTDFDETFDVERLSKEIDEVVPVLVEKYGITERPKLHIITNVS
jgi:hypothetical protein